jgi:hypothetical protein
MQPVALKKTANIVPLMWNCKAAPKNNPVSGLLKRCQRLTGAC